MLRSVISVLKDREFYPFRRLDVGFVCARRQVLTWIVLRFKYRTLAV